MADINPASPLGNLSARRQQIVDGLELDLVVPRWDNPEVHVVYKPADSDELAKTLDPKKLKNNPEATLNANADLLAKCCLRVYAKLPDDDTQYSLDPDNPTGELTRFDDRLARNLEIVETTARAVVKGLYFTDGDLLSHCIKLAMWSGYAVDESLSDFRGE